MRDTKKEVVYSIKASGDDNKLVLLERETDPVGEGLRVQASGISSPYILHFGKATYEISEIKFYNDNGVTYTNRSGWLEGAYSKRFRAMEIQTNQEQFKRVKIDNKFSFSTAYRQDLVFFVSLGKDWDGANKAHLYIPTSYLHNTGYEVVKTTITADHSVHEETRLYTPTFQIYVNGRHEKRFDNIKADMLTQLQKCETQEELKAFIKAWEYKL